jgi:hypothetical protein
MRYQRSRQLLPHTASAFADISVLMNLVNISGSVLPMA